MRTIVVKLLVLATALLASVAAQAQQAEGNWLVRVRAIDIMPDHSSDAGITAKDAVTLNDVIAPEVDISYFLTKNIAAELILTYPQQHDVNLAGAGKIGTVKHLPPTLTLQYHFLPDGQFRPYVGAGLNFTKFSSANIAGGTMNVDSSSTGGALQAGIDIKLGSNLYLNFDIKKIWIGTDVTLARTGAKVTHLNLNPLLPGVGLGWRF